MRLKKIIFLSVLVSLGLALNIVESMIPFPIIIPGAKLGLSNIVSLVALVLFGFKEAIVISILKGLVLALATGNFSTLLYSIPSATGSTIIMTLAYEYLRNYFSLIGVSILGALTHNFLQITVASLIMQNINIFSYLPFMALTSLFTGYFIGLSSIYLVKNMKNTLGGYLK
ncbi:heptaprenyl diphosphate synthase component I [Gottschalkia purinilytica]|uniref:Heptaprenyl diphosphate synthase component I n=1 Tax=Gottschalkia purinilytica TaxID=1503 RepID=A0A0L0WDC0_GOTPU|nr:Gx transporter family protein [Gottschalkia purinilytica]KNF09464.1 heptaprenyl diphosphate synthase component I [Gottschalkia purinilytica]